MTDTQILAGLSDVQALGLTMLGEARGDAKEGSSSVEERVAVACVVRNRARHPRRWAATLKGVCLQRLQFSCWNVRDPNRAKLLAIAYRLVTHQPVMDAMVDETLYLAEGIARGIILDRTGGADHYLTTSLFHSSKRPSWASKIPVVRRIGSHVFLREQALPKRRSV